MSETLKGQPAHPRAPITEAEALRTALAAVGGSSSGEDELREVISGMEYQLARGGRVTVSEDGARSILAALQPSSAADAKGVTYSQAEFDECGRIGERDGYESAIQDLDLATGGDGEFRGSTDPSRCVDVDAMKARIIERFAALKTGEAGR